MMAALEGFVAGGAAAGFILVLMLAEALILWQRRRARLPAILLALAPGFCLVAALGAALQNAPALVVAGLLALSLPLHLADLRLRGW